MFSNGYYCVLNLINGKSVQNLRFKNFITFFETKVMQEKEHAKSENKTILKLTNNVTGGILAFFSGEVDTRLFILDSIGEGIWFWSWVSFFNNWS